VFDGEGFRARRRRLGLTQAQVASRSGVPQPNLSAIETSRVQPSAATVERLERALRRRPSEALAEHKDELISLGERLGVTNLRVYGSTMRGEDTVDSDLDLVGTLAPGLSYFDLAEFEIAAEELLGVPVEVMTSGSVGRVAQRVLAEALPL
jgi:predicted nucleotidyltransferase